jgi:hypothetical protein
MNSKQTLFGLPLPQAIGLFSFLTVIISIWIHLEISLAELNVEIANLKQDLLIHKSENRKDLETLQTDINTDTKEILRKIDEIQIYLRNNK